MNSWDFPLNSSFEPKHFNWENTVSIDGWGADKLEQIQPPRVSKPKV